MHRRFALFTLLGVAVTISPLGVISFLAVVPLWAWIAAGWLRLSLTSAVIAGLLSAGVMFVSECLHQFGHALAARRTGYPMIGIHFFSLLSMSRYPKDEPELPARVHIRRALGGFWINLLIGLLLAPYALFTWIQGGVTGWVMGFTAFYNFFVLGLGALLPIDIPGVFTIDGGTLWRYWRKR